MAETMIAAPEASPAPGLNDLQRIIGTFFSPGATFVDIVKRPTWLAPLVLLTVIWLGLCAALAQRVDWVETSKQQIEKNKFAASHIESLSSDEKARIYEQSAERSKSWQYVRGVIGWPILILFSAGLNFGAYKLMTGIRTNFATAFAISAFAHLPMGLRELIAIPVTFLKDPESIDPTNFLASNIAAFLGDSAPIWQLILFGSLDVFTIWAVVLVAVGFSAADPKKVRIGKSLAVAFGTTYSIFLFFTMMAWIFL